MSAVKNDPTTCGICDRALTDADGCTRDCPYKPMTMPQRIAHCASSIRIKEELAAEKAARKVQELAAYHASLPYVLPAFEKAHEKACQSSEPDDWQEAAMLGKQLANLVWEHLKYSEDFEL